MLRNLLLMGFAVAFAMAVPFLYESNPELLEGVFRRDREQAGTVVAQPPAVPVAMQPASTEPEVLLGRKVRVPADSRGHFSAEFKLNGRGVEALIDTGATVVAINRSTARRIGIQLMPADFVYQVNTANGATKAAAATIAQLQIGRIYLENVEAMVLDDAALRTTLIGMSFLKRLGKFQVENGALLLAQ